MAAERLRSPRVQGNHAVGDTGRHTDSSRVSDHPVELLCEYSRPPTKMSESFSTEAPEFDRYAEEYDAALANGLYVSGEDKEYFARGRISWLTRCCEQEQERPGAVMDFGCGTGSATPFLLGMPRV